MQKWTGDRLFSDDQKTVSVMRLQTFLSMKSKVCGLGFNCDSLRGVKTTKRWRTDFFSDVVLLSPLVSTGASQYTVHLKKFKIR